MRVKRTMPVRSNPCSLNTERKTGAIRRKYRRSGKNEPPERSRSFCIIRSVQTKVNTVLITVPAAAPATPMAGNGPSPKIRSAFITTFTIFPATFVFMMTAVCPYPSWTAWKIRVRDVIKTEKSAIFPYTKAGEIYSSLAPMR